LSCRRRRAGRSAPQIGDADDGRLQELTRTDKRDHLYLLSLAAALTGDGGFKVSERPGAEAFWLLGEGSRSAECRVQSAERRVNGNDGHHKEHEGCEGRKTDCSGDGNADNGKPQRHKGHKERKTDCSGDGNADNGKPQRDKGRKGRETDVMVTAGTSYHGERRSAAPPPPNPNPQPPTPKPKGIVTENSCSSCSLCPLWVRSCAFPDSGFYVLRSRRMYAFVSCRRGHPLDNGAHVHNDHLSFTLSVDGSDFIVDAGTYTYTADLAERNRFRSSSAHNTIVVDGREINPLSRSDPFRLRDRAGCRVMEWRSDEERDVLVAGHEGYARMGVGVRREFVLDKGADVFSVRDVVKTMATKRHEEAQGDGEKTIAAKRHEVLKAATRLFFFFAHSRASLRPVCKAPGREHRIEWRFLFAPEVKVEIGDEGVKASRDGVEMRIRFEGGGGLKAGLEAGWYSPGYGVRQETQRLIVAGMCGLPVEMEFVFERAGEVSNGGIGVTAETCLPRGCAGMARRTQRETGFSDSDNGVCHRGHRGHGGRITDYGRGEGLEADCEGGGD